MKEVKINRIDYEALGRALQDLRERNDDLRKYVCWRLQADAEDDLSVNFQCTNELNCENCRFPANRSISRKELSLALGDGVSENMVTSWEMNRSVPDVEYLLAYCKICGLDFMQFIKEFMV